MEIPRQYRLYTNLYEFMKDVSNKWIQKIYSTLEKSDEGLSFTELRKCVFIEEGEVARSNKKRIPEQELSKGLKILEGKGFVKRCKDKYIAESLENILVKNSNTKNLSHQGGVYSKSLYILGISKLDDSEEIKKLSRKIDKSFVELGTFMEKQQVEVFNKYFKLCIEGIKPYDLKVFLRDNEKTILGAIINILSERGDDSNHDFKKFLSVLLLDKTVGEYYSNANERESRRLIKVLKIIWSGSPVGPIKIIWKNNNYSQEDLKNLSMIYEGVSQDNFK